MPKKATPLPNLLDVGKRLAIARKNAGLDQKTAAIHLDVSAPNLSRYERGAMEAGAGFFLAASSLYGVSLDWLLSGRDEEKILGVTVPETEEPSRVQELTTEPDALESRSVQRFDINKVIRRVALKLGCAPTQAEVAKRFSISSQDFSARKMRGTLIYLFIDWALINNISVDWVLTGKESEPRAGPRPSEALIRLPRGDSEPLSKQDAELVEKVLVVLRAKGEKADQFSSLLKHTVDVTFTGVRQDNRLSGSPGETAMQHKKGA